MKNDFRTYTLAVAFYRLTQALVLPKHLKGQLAKAASSIALNLAEGTGRATKADQKHFFNIAFGSLRECQAILVLARAEDTQAWRTLDSLAAHLYRLVQSLS